MVPRSLRLLIPLLLLPALLTPTACAALNSGQAPLAPAQVAKAVDQLTGVYVAYEQSDHGDAARLAAITASLNVLGVTALQDLDAVVPSATGQLLAARLAQAHPELSGYQTTIAKLWTIALYGNPTAHAPAPDPGGGSPATAPMTMSMLGSPARQARRRRRRGGHDEPEALAAGPGPEACGLSTA